LSGTVRVGAFELDTRARELRRGTIRVRLQDQPFEILRMLLARPGDVVTREELRRQLWPAGTYVDFEHSLNAAVKRLRAALGDDADCPRFVETLPRRGYRFIATSAAGEDPAPAGAPAPRLAVLPFSNLSDERHEYFSDGLTEELIAQIGSLCRGHIGVLARWSSMMFKGTLLRAREIGDTLRARYLLEGSVRREGERVRVTARLIDAETETHLWAQAYDRDLTDCLAVQTNVAAEIARALLRELAPATTRDAVPQSVPPSAYQAYLKGRYYWNKAGDDGLDQAIAFYRHALDLDPTFARAHAALARVHVSRAEYYCELPRQALSAARAAAQQALRHDPTLHEAHMALAEVQRTLDWDWRGAEESYRQAIALNPSSEGARRGYSVMLAALGRSAEAMRESARACELDPLCLVVGGSAAFVAYMAGDYDAAIEYSRNTVDMDPEFAPARRVLGATYLQAGRAADAVVELEAAVGRIESPMLLAWLAHAKAVTGHRSEAEALVARARGSAPYVSSYHLAIAYVGLDDLDRAFEALDVACLDRDPMLLHVAVEPRFEPLRGDPRFFALLDRMKMPSISAPDPSRAASASNPGRRAR
jgi:TolB-like protein/Tfp pilus assembly protein PilF